MHNLPESIPFVAGIDVLSQLGLAVRKRWAGESGTSRMGATGTPSSRSGLVALGSGGADRR